MQAACEQLKYHKQCLNFNDFHNTNTSKLADISKLHSAPQMT